MTVVNLEEKLREAVASFMTLMEQDDRPDVKAFLADFAELGEPFVWKLYDAIELAWTMAHGSASRNRRFSDVGFSDVDAKSAETITGSLGEVTGDILEQGVTLGHDLRSADAGAAETASRSSSRSRR